MDPGISGLLRVVTQSGYLARPGPRHGAMRLRPGRNRLRGAGVIHAWLRAQDTDVLVFTKGPRSGAAYESDTFKLPGALL